MKADGVSKTDAETWNESVLRGRTRRKGKRRKRWDEKKKESVGREKRVGRERTNALWFRTT